MRSYTWSWLRIFALLLMVAMMLVSMYPRPVVAQNNRLTVVASTTIIADVVGNVAGGAADVTSLMGFEQDPHTYEPSGADIALLDEADVVFINGAGFEERILPVLSEAVNAEHLYEISLCVEILPFGAEVVHDHEGEVMDNDHAGEDAHVDDEHQDATVTESSAARCAAHTEALHVMIDEGDHAGTGHARVEPLGPLYAIECGIGHGQNEEHHHEAGSCDPHTWTSVHNVMYWTLLARDILSELDPANAEVYAANAAHYLEQLHILDTELHDLFAALPQERRILVTNHDTFSYLANEYGIEIVGTVIPGATTAAEPSAGDVASLIEVIQDYGVSAIFTENTVSDSLATQIAAETGAVVFKLYTDSLTNANGEAPTYIDMMHYNVTTIVHGLNH